MIKTKFKPSDSPKKHGETEGSLHLLNRDMEHAQRLAKTGSWRLDHATGHLYWSKEIFRILGIDPVSSPVSYEYFLECVHPEDRDLVDQAYANSLNKHEPYDIVHRLLLEDGTIKYVQELGTTTFNDEGDPLITHGSVQDITQRVNHESETRRALHLLRTALEMVDCGSWEWSVEADQTWWSEKVYEIFGRDPALPPVAYPHVKDYFTEESWGKMGPAIEKCLNDGTPYQCEAEMILPDGQRRWTISYGYRETGLSGKTTFLYGLVRDITRRKKLEQEIAKKIRAEQLSSPKK